MYAYIGIWLTNNSNIFLFICIIRSLCKIFIFFLCFDNQVAWIHWKIDENEILNFFSFGFYRSRDMGILIDWWKENLEFAFIFSLWEIFLIAGHGDIERLVKTEFLIFAFHFLFLFSYIFSWQGHGDIHWLFFFDSK
jgi:hypothetical protein